MSAVSNKQFMAAREPISVGPAAAASNPKFRPLSAFAISEAAYTSAAKEPKKTKEDVFDLHIKVDKQIEATQLYQTGLTEANVWDLINTNKKVQAAFFVASGHQSAQLNQLTHKLHQSTPSIAPQGLFSPLQSQPMPAFL